MLCFGSAGRVCSVLCVLAIGSLPLPSCAPRACPAIGYISSVTVHITPERAATLAKLDLELCQDGTCHDFSIDPSATLTLGAVPAPTSPNAFRAAPVRTADGGIDVRIEASINDDPLDLTTSGTDASGGSIGMSHVRLSPTTSYPAGKGCGGPTTASATLDRLGLRSG